MTYDLHCTHLAHHREYAARSGHRPSSATGMAVPRKIRQNQIEANRAELETHGPLRMELIQSAGRPSTAYYLNEEQALLVCMFSRTDKAAAVRKLVIDTFMAVRRGQQPITVLSIPNFANPGEAARA